MNGLNVLGHTFWPLLTLIKINLPIDRVTQLRLLCCYYWIVYTLQQMAVDPLCWCHLTSAQLLTQLIMMFYSAGLITASVLLALLTCGSRHTSLIGVNSFVLALTPHNLLPVISGCPKAPCLDTPFSIYTSPISKISRIHNVQQPQYADDTQLYVAVTPYSVLS